MSTYFVSGRSWRRLFPSLGVFLFVLSGAFVRGQSLPEDAPVLISEPDSVRAVVAAPSKEGLDYEARVFKPGAKTRITVFVTNLDLMEGEGAKAFRADVEDFQHWRYPLKIVSLEPTEERKWVYALTVQLHGGIGDVGDVQMRVTWRGMSSNRVRVSIGHEGDGLKDDPGSFPTPMPEKPPTKNQASEQFVGVAWTGDRVRFMEQATFGVTANVESRLRRIGYSTWLEEQLEQKFATDGGIRYSTFPYPNVVPLNTEINVGCPDTATRVSCTRNNYTMYPLQNWFYREAIYGEDQQLRRRVSWALHQIWVVSGRDIVQSGRMLPYIQTLDKHAFGNYRDLMLDMTLNPAMGQYLDMAISTRQNPNENYAREILQLFSIGLFMLNQDGTPILDSQGNPIPTYDQETVNNFTRVFTGWTFCNQGCPNSQPGIVNYRDPMRQLRRITTPIRKFYCAARSSRRSNARRGFTTGDR